MTSLLSGLDNFAVGIASSIIGSIIIAILLLIVKYPKFNDKATTFYLRITNKVFKNQKEALKQMEKDYEDSSIIKILAIRGKDFSDPGGDLKFLWNSYEKQIEIINSSINNKFAIDGRASSYPSCVNSYEKTLESVHEEMLDKLKKYRNFDYYNHNIDLIFRIVIFRKAIYVSFFKCGRTKDDSEVYKYDRDTQMYAAFEKYYDTIKAISIPVKVPFEK